MKRLPLTVLIAARNEAANIARCLRSLGWAERVVLLDSQSTDATTDIALAFGAEVIQFRYQGGYPKKRQWALNTLAIDTPWILLLDADEAVPEALWREIEVAFNGTELPDAFLIRKEFHFLGRRLRFGAFSHAAVLLFRSGRARFEHLVEESDSGLDMEVHERVIVEGRIANLTTPLIHEDFKGLPAYLEKHRRYALWEATLRNQFLASGRYGEQAIEPKLFGNTQERRRWLKKLVIRLPGEPLIWFCWHYVISFGFLEGRAGWVAARVRARYIADVRKHVSLLQRIGNVGR